MVCIPKVNLTFSLGSPTKDGKCSNRRDATSVTKGTNWHAHAVVYSDWLHRCKSRVMPRTSRDVSQIRTRHRDTLVSCISEEIDLNLRARLLVQRCTGAAALL